MPSKELSGKLNGAAVYTKAVALDQVYLNAVNSNKTKNNKQTKDPPPGDLIVVTCYAGKKMAFLNVLIDHGSQTSAISEKALQKTGENEKMRSTSVRLTSAQGSEFPVKGRVELEVQFGSKDYNCDLVVTSLLLPGIDDILGSDFFSNHSTKLFTYPNKEPLFILENQIIPLVKSEMADNDLNNYQVFNIVQSEEEILGNARIAKATTIPGREEGFLKIKLPRSINKYKNDKLLFTPRWLQYYEDLGFLEGVVRAHETNKGVSCPRTRTCRHRGASNCYG